MLIKAMLSVFGAEYKFAEAVVLLGLQRTRISISSDTKKALIDRVHRLRLDTKLALTLLWLAVVLIALPPEFEIWDLEFQLWVLRLITPLLQFLSYLQGFAEGTAFGVFVAVTVYGFIQWMELQRQKYLLYYLFYRCK